MKNTIAKTMPIVLALILMLTMAAGCPRAAEETPTPAPEVEQPRTIVITDSAGREIELSLPVDRVIVLNMLAAEVIHAIGAADRVIGVCGSTAGDASLPGLYGQTMVSPRGHAEVDHEKIIELRPQVVITWGTHAMVDLPAFAETLAPAGIPVLGIDAFRLATLFEDIETLGKLFEKEEAAARLVEFLQKPIDLIEGRVGALSPGEKVRVFAEHHRQFMAWGPGSDQHKMIEAAGGMNIFADIGRAFLVIDPEKVITRNPQVIMRSAFGAPMGFGATDLEPIREYLAGVIARPGWENLEAVKEGRVYLVSVDIGSGPPEIILNLFIGKILHPELFADVDPESFLREYFEEFHGVEFKGIFVYPQP
ncbi:ABC transporter substrate-binding protein [Dehalococcoidia bacterium]|nr:ABC transporter substrate-binding protein [Dehalococcoidia bacterium]